MRGHGGSDPVAGPYTMAQLADDVAAALDFLGIAKVQFVGLSIGGMLGQAFAIAHGQRLVSAMLCDTSPQTPPGAQAAWAPRIEAVTKANSVAPLADGTMERWFTDAYKPRNPGRWKQIHATIAGTTPAGYLGCAAAILDFDFAPQLPQVKVPTLVVCGANDEGTPPAGNKLIAELVPGGRYEEIAAARAFPQRRATRGVQRHPAGLARRASLREREWPRLEPLDSSWPSAMLDAVRRPSSPSASFEQVATSRR